MHTYDDPFPTYSIGDLVPTHDNLFPVNDLPSPGDPFLTHSNPLPAYCSFLRNLSDLFPVPKITLF